jgi:glycosyltransferase involved in cell wall biosynthesis
LIGSEYLNGMIFMTDSPTDLLLKGEITPTYFNPDGVFKSIDFVLNHPRDQDFLALEKMVGDASIRLFYLNLPRRYFLKSLGWRAKYLEKKARELVKQENFVKPDVIRAFNPFVEAGIAAHVAIATLSPFIVSLHGAYDVDPITTSKTREFIIKRFQNDLARRVISSADLTVGVYLDASNYGKRMGARRVETVYNAVSKPLLKSRSFIKSEEFDDTIRLISVNRQDPLKNPINIVKAMSHLENTKMLLVGKGTMSSLIRLEIEKRGLTDRVTMVPSLENSDLLQLVQDCDIYVATCHYGGLSKGTIEAALMGKAILLNLNSFKDNELEGDWLLRCIDSEKGYTEALQDLISNVEMRSAISLRASQFAKKHFEPATLNAKWFDLYQEVVASSR